MAMGPNDRQVYMLYCVIISSVLLHKSDGFIFMENLNDVCGKDRAMFYVFQILVTGFQDNHYDDTHISSSLCEDARLLFNAVELFELGIEWSQGQ